MCIRDGRVWSPLPETVGSRPPNCFFSRILYKTFLFLFLNVASFLGPLQSAGFWNCIQGAQGILRRLFEKSAMQNGVDSNGDPALKSASSVSKVLEEMGAETFYKKTLTSSDANGAGRVVIPKAVAEHFFPPLDNQAGVPIDASDTMGNKYSFRFRFWINNQSRMYLLEGVSEMHQQYNLKVGDVMVFSHLPDKSLVVYGRPMTQADVLNKTSMRRTNGSSTGVKREFSRRTLKHQQPKKTRKLSELSPKMRREESPPEEPQEIYPPPDGVFRALPTSLSEEESRVFTQNGVWAVVIEITGEKYQAFFDTKIDALEAFNAAGFGTDSVVSSDLTPALIGD